MHNIICIIRQKTNGQSGGKTDNFKYTKDCTFNVLSNQTRVQPTEPNTAQHNFLSLLVVVYPTTNKCLVGIGYPTTNIHHFISWCCVPNTNNCWVVLCTQLFSQKRSSMRKESFLPQGFFSCPKNKPVMAVFKFLKQVQQIMTIFEMFDLKLGQMLHNPTVVYPTTKLTKC